MGSGNGIQFSASKKTEWDVCRGHGKRESHEK